MLTLSNQSSLLTKTDEHVYNTVISMCSHIIPLQFGLGVFFHTPHPRTGYFISKMPLSADIRIYRAKSHSLYPFLSLLVSVFQFMSCTSSTSQCTYVVPWHIALPIYTTVCPLKPLAYIGGAVGFALSQLFSSVNFGLTPSQAGPVQC